MKDKNKAKNLSKGTQRVPLIKKPELLTDISEETEELIKIFVASLKTAEKKKR